jgi:hypothetical protein
VHAWRVQWQGAEVTEILCYDNIFDAITDDAEEAACLKLCADIAIALRSVADAEMIP